MMGTKRQWANTTAMATTAVLTFWLGAHTYNETARDLRNANTPAVQEFKETRYALNDLRRELESNVFADSSVSYWHSAAERIGSLEEKLSVIHMQNPDIEWEADRVDRLKSGPFQAGLCYVLGGLWALCTAYGIKDMKSRKGNV
jgi:hypothetical protein